MKATIKRAVSIVCVIAMLMSMIVTANAAGMTLTVGSKSMQQSAGSESVQLPISIAGNPGIAGLQLKLSYAEGLTLESITTGNALGSLTFTVPGDLTKNPVTLPWDGLDGDSSNGTIVTLTFNVPKAEVKDYDVTVTVTECYDGSADMNDVAVAVTNGKISITEKPKEDMQGVTLANGEFTYDGKAKSLAVSGAPAGATITHENNGKTDAGTYNVKATVTAPGYNDKVLNATLKINPKTITVTGLTAANKVYDGTKAATISGGALSGVVSGDDVSATFPTSGTFAKATVENGIAVTFNTITLSGAKKANYTLTQPSLKANITAAPITVTADSHSIMIGDALPELTYQITSGKLAEGDSFSGKLSTKANASKEGTYDILQGTLKLSSNYKLTYAKGTITVSDKTAQNITVSEITNKVYGDEGFIVTATADETAGLSNFTYESTNTDVAEIAADGTVTIVGAGETEIIVKEPGDDTYAPFEKTQTLVVSGKEVTVDAIDLNAKSAIIVGVLDGDKEAVEIDFDKLVVEIIEEEIPEEVIPEEDASGEDVPAVASVEEIPEGETPENGDEIPEDEEVKDISVKVRNFVLKGEKAANYIVTTEELETTASEDVVATVSAVAANGTVTGNGTYLVGSEITLLAEANSGYKFSGWYVGDESISTDAEYTFVLEEDIELVAKFTKKLTGGTGGGLQAGGVISKPKDDKEENKPTIVIPETPATSTDGEKFIDLGGYDWAKDAINSLAEQGIIKGTSYNTYSPAMNITRADFAALIVRIFNLTSANEENFDDVSAADYFASELAIARNTGVVGGVGNNKFAPRNNISRQDMMVMIYRAMTKQGYELTSGEISVNDFEAVSDYAKEAVKALVANGIINGKNGNVDPMANATRAEVAVMLSRVLDFIK